jgi:mannose/fructose/N-acetylgalactosamine-specific phosphotransferase system component IIC
LSTSLITTLTNCVNAGIIKGNIWVGSIIGGNRDVVINNCINIGVVENGSSYIGCITGWSNNNSNVTITNCEWDKQTCKYGAVGTP